MERSEKVNDSKISWGLMIDDSTIGKAFTYGQDRKQHLINVCP